MRRHGMNFRKWVMNRFVIPYLRRLPIERAHLLSERIGQFEFRLLFPYRNALLRTVEDGKARLEADWDVSGTAQQLAGRLTRWRIRDILLDGLDDQAALAAFDVIGRENLDDAISRGKGVVLVSNHFGGHILPAHWMLRSGIDFRFLTERPRHISKALSDYFQSDGPTGQKDLFISRRNLGNEGVSSLFRSIRCLKSKLVLLVACDVRWDDNQSVVGQFMGLGWKFTPIWAILSQRSGAPVVPVFCSMLPDGRHLLEFCPPEQISGSANLTEVVQRALDRVEARVKADPGNSNDYFFWSIEDSVSTKSLHVDGTSKLVSEPVSSTGVTPHPHFQRSSEAHQKIETMKSRD
jgi:phosphatidylinositol dimannoside acyltransferase